MQLPDVAAECMRGMTLLDRYVTEQVYHVQWLRNVYRWTGVYHAQWGAGCRHAGVGRWEMAMVCFGVGGKGTTSVVG